MNLSEAYKILGVDTSTSEDDIKKAYRKLAKKYHPDVNRENKNAEEKFKEITLAYDTITKKDYLGNDLNGRNFSGRSNPVDFAEFFNRRFEQQPRPQKRPRPGSQPIRLGEIAPLDIPITLLEALTGGSISLELEVLACCDNCLGDASRWIECATCKGYGMISRSIKTSHGFINTTKSCTRCNKVGWTTERSCRICKGKLVYHKKKEVNFTIPPRYSIGKLLQFSGLGNEGWKVTPGCLGIMPIIDLPDLSKLNIEDCALLNELLKKGWKKGG